MAGLTRERQQGRLQVELRPLLPVDRVDRNCALHKIVKLVV